ncbi:hypothetical protein [Psychroserpens damuponensis]|uniref:hypothetical protein n=1 Tax=Psychroserpens damuponensis TaxID=943936 RepID=UPI00058BF962|nr:hypothetical protein [Psychroserpens damuponensis]
MKKYALLLIIFGCLSCSIQKVELNNALPKDYVIYETYFADLNNDQQEDCILIIKDTNKAKKRLNRFDTIVDRNRRGIIILFKKNNNYTLVDKNYDCFSSENEEGGVYYPPQLSIETQKEDLIIQYNHGRYGSWSYRFRLIEANFKLIKYEATRNYGPIITKETTLDFLTKKKLVRKNINENAKGGDEVFENKYTTIVIDTLIELSKIEDFDNLDLSIY